MSLLDQLGSVETWERFYSYKTSLCCSEKSAAELRKFIENREYLPVCVNIENGVRFPLPSKTVISKQHSQKKRVVYTYPQSENTVLKLLTYLLLRKYDGLFARGLYSFRPNRTAKDAVAALRRINGIGEMFSYKVDVSNYFNSIDIARFLPMLKDALSDDQDLYRFLASLLEEKRVLENGREIEEQKGIMAGTPLAAFYANLYLMDLDRSFAERGIPYSRYSDDIIVFARTEEEARSRARDIRAFLAQKGLGVNPSKEEFASPETGWTYLGFFCKGDVVDIAPVSVEKLKKKMRRKTRALKRWQERNGLEGEKSAKAFIRVFNRKLFENPADNELTWTYWFFPVINTAESLKVIDNYAQDCIRYLISGSRTKSRFNVRYEDMKALGYRNLVHAYYDYSDEERERRGKKRNADSE